MNLVEQLRDKIAYHNQEIYELQQLIREAQKICKHNYISDIPSISTFKDVCSNCGKTRYI